MPTEATHRVFNQVPDLTGFNPFTSDTTLQSTLERLGGGWNAGALQAFGDQLGAPETLRWATEANTYHPELHTHSRTGERMCTSQVCSQPLNQRVRWRSHGRSRAGASS
mgnify:CR=1 FL=1